MKEYFMKEYFVLMKPQELHGTIKLNNKRYGYDTLFLSNFQGTLIKKEYTTFSQNIRCTFQLQDKVIYVHHKFLEKIKSQLIVGKLYNVTVNEDKPYLIEVKTWHEKWKMFVPVGAELEGVSKTNNRFMVYLYDPENKTAKSYGNFQDLENAVIFRDYCKHRRWDKKLQNNPHIGLKRSKKLKHLFKHSKNKGDLFNKLDEYFKLGEMKKKKETTIQPAIIKRVPVPEGDVFDRAYAGLNCIEVLMSKNIVFECTTLSEYMNTVRAIHIARNTK